MARKQDPKCKQCRTEGMKLYLKGDRCFTPKCAMSRRPFKPGMHGPTSKSKPTQFGLQLREKQKAKNIYGIKERQFRNYFDKAASKVGNTSEHLVQMLEMRLDNIIYRLGLGRSRSLARQLVAHGLVLVNGKRVTIASYQVKSGDVVSLKKSIKESKLFENEGPRLEKVQTPGWLHLEPTVHEGKVLNLPSYADAQQNFDPKLIVEFYSR